MTFLCEGGRFLVVVEVFKKAARFGSLNHEPARDAAKNAGVAWPR
jgi:hypothetical protein